MCSKELRHGLRSLYRAVAVLDRSTVAPIDPEHALKLNTLITSATVLLDSLPSFRKVPSILAEDGCPVPRVIVIAQGFVEADDISHLDSDWRNYLSLLRLDSPLTYSELVLLKTALQLSTLLDFIRSEGCAHLAAGAAPLQLVIAQLDTIEAYDHEGSLSELLTFESCLGRDPAGLYSTLDVRTKHVYRRAVATLADSWSVSSVGLCTAILELCHSEFVPEDVSLRLRCHVGFYLLDDVGQQLLQKKLGASSKSKRPPKYTWVLVYLAFSIFVAAIVSGYISRGDRFSLWTLLLGFAMLVVASRSVGQILMPLVNATILPAELPSLDLRGISVEHPALVVMPCMLLGEQYISSLAERLRRLAADAGEDNVYFVVLTEFTDCPDLSLLRTRDAQLLQQCSLVVEGLNDLSEYAVRRPFFLLHRERVYSRRERRWMGWERKRGKIMQLSALVTRGKNDFSHIVGDVGRLRAARYMLVLDDDNKLSPGVIRSLVGTITHPLNHLRIDKRNRKPTRGYGVLQPGLRSAEAGPSGIPARDIYQDLLGQSTFYGKGLMDVQALDFLLDGALPENRILGHDIVESTFIPTAAATHAELLEEVPHFHGSVCRRTHRWIRGDWQNLWWLAGEFPSKHGKMTLAGPLGMIENVRNSLTPIAIAGLMVAGALRYPWLFVVVPVMVLGPGYLFLSYSSVRLARCGAPKTLLRWVVTTLGYCWSWLCVTAATLHEGLISMDAIVRTLRRLLYGTKLLEWEPSAASDVNRAKLNLCRSYQWATIVVCTTLAALVLARPGEQRNVALFCLLVLWALASVLRLSGIWTAPAP
jgi:cyclic beta-1,2-glucan synthetase